VVGSDGSETAKLAVRTAAEMAARTDARLHVVSAYEPLSGLRVKGGDAAGAEASAPAPDAGVRAVLDEALGSCRALGVECDVYARTGNPAEAVLEVAEEQGADLIVVGSKGMTGTRRFLLGSVPDKVSHHAACSVLIVRTT
jgi:nucleotide-binding universal stress UspA family protein